MGYTQEDIGALVEEGEGGLLNKLFGKGIGKWAMKNRRPVSYDTDEGSKHVKQDPSTKNWSNVVRDKLYGGLFGREGQFEEGEDIYIQDEDGSMILNPNATGKTGQYVKEIQAMLNKTFEKAKTGKLYEHPDLPDAGKNFYKSDDPTLGDAYFDKEGNVVDYWDVGLDKGEKPFSSKANFQRWLVDPFTSPKTFKGKANVSADETGKFSGRQLIPEEEVSQEPEKEKGPGVLSKVGGFFEGIGDVLSSGSGYTQPDSKIQDALSQFDAKEIERDAPQPPPSLASYLDEKEPISAPTTSMEGMVDDYKQAATGKTTSTKDTSKAIDQVIEEDVGEGTGKLDNLFSALKDKFRGAQEMGEGAVDKVKGINRQSIMQALGLGEDEEEEDYEATMMNKLKGLGYRGSARQNIELMKAMGGKGPSIVDYLKGQGQESSMAARRKLWEQFG